MRRKHMLDIGLSEWLNQKITGNTPNKGTDKLLYNNIGNANLVDSRPQSQSNNNTQNAPAVTPKGSSVNKSSNGSSVSGAYSNMTSSLNKSAKDAESALRQRSDAYNNLYEQLNSNLKAQKGDVTTQRDTALTGMDNDYENALTRANSSKEAMGEYYDNQEEDLNKSYGDQRKERERIFQARNITNSSYYIDAVTDADTAFNKTLSSLGKDEARNILEVDTQIKELGTERMTKRTEIETAFNQAMRQIEADITKTEVEKADAMDRLQGEYETKVGTINQQLLSIQQQQQSYREKVAKSSFDTGYSNTTYGIDLNNKALQMKTPDSQQAILQALMATKGTDGYINPDEYARLRSLVTAAPGTFDGKFGSYLDPNDKAKLGLTAPKAATTTNTSDLFKNL